MHPAARGQARASYWLRSPSSPAPDKGQRQARSTVDSLFHWRSLSTSDLPPASHQQSLTTTGTLTQGWQGRRHESPTYYAGLTRGAALAPAVVFVRGVVCWCWRGRSGRVVLVGWLIISVCNENDFEVIVKEKHFQLSRSEMSLSFLTTTLVRERSAHAVSRAGAPNAAVAAACRRSRRPRCAPRR